MNIAHSLPDNLPKAQEARPSFSLTGFAARTTNRAEQGPDGLIPGLWRTYYQSGLPLDSSVANPHLIYALYTDYESDASGAYTLVIGHESAAASAEDAAEEPRAFVSAEQERLRALVPASRYRIFKTRRGPVGEVVAEAWGQIWAYYEQSSERRAYTGDFELYDTRDFDPEAAEVSIYIAVR
ncbi:AraC family transcriptional regulator [Saccharibacillus sp. O23]|uniref:GyrI-like domain-containing protein n=1 Tax=Saccharibacillus sp. O23 TaxID=2009338 RepID=UPI000B4E4083|nr:effector binding domain-containing protein [Saccharibacillus sp. O23]OWR31870.1 AraC family transcriptional regulator [Saccharibacillus sp. O23]